ncbi:MAG: DUF4157 domain-containing protein [Pseudomonadota bacterium]
MQRRGAAAHGPGHLTGLQAAADASPASQRLATLQRAADGRPAAATGPTGGSGNGLPEPLKSGIESLSGQAMDHVNVHYNSPRPVQLNAHAYAQGSDIHLAPGQERHLAHEAWHVVQQGQGRVRPTGAIGDQAVNDDPGLEREADVKGAEALQRRAAGPVGRTPARAPGTVLQAAIDPDKLTAAKTLLSLADAKVVEVPKGEACKGNTTFANYPAGSTAGLSAGELNMTIAGITYGDQAAEYDDVSASLILSLCGGAGYVATPGIAFVTEGMKDYERALTHELGHHKQNVESGYTFENTTRALLEYHNILLNENLFGGTFRVHYVKDQTVGWASKWQKAKTQDDKAALAEGYAQQATAQLPAMQAAVTGSTKPNDAAVYAEIRAKLAQLQSGLGAEDIEARFTYARFVWNLTHEGKDAIPT